jgi:hypothetical protein
VEIGIGFYLTVGSAGGFLGEILMIIVVKLMSYGNAPRRKLKNCLVSLVADVYTF